MNKYKKITLDGIIFNNPTFMLVLGTCPTLGLISNALSALEMGLAVIVILTLSNMIISALRKLIPNEVRIPCYIVVIATLVTLIRMVLDKFLPDVYDALGGFLALIVVNCIILGRAEAVANKHTVAERLYHGADNNGNYLRIPRQGKYFRRADHDFQHRAVQHARRRVHRIRTLDLRIHGDNRYFPAREARKGE